MIKIGESRRKGSTIMATKKSVKKAAKKEVKAAKKEVAAAQQETTPRKLLQAKVQRIELSLSKLLAPRFTRVGISRHIENAQVEMGLAAAVIADLPVDWRPTGQGSSGFKAGLFVVPKQIDLFLGAGPYRILETVGRKVWLDLGAEGKALVAKRELVPATGT
jgi:hypothetical protein